VKKVSAEVVEGLPELLEELSNRWRLTRIGEPFPATSSSFVAPVVGPGDRHFVLKISPRLESIAREGHALACWRGRGAVRLIEIDASRGALLLDHVMTGDRLATVVASGDRRATHVASGVIRALQSGAAGRHAGLPTIERTWLDHLHSPAIAGGSKALQEACAEARSLAGTLLNLSGERVVLHGDLHHDNILKADDSWVAIDPHGTIGPPEAEASALLRNPRSFVLARRDPCELMRQRIDALAVDLAWDPSRIAAWGWVGAVVAAAWSFEDDEGEEEVNRWLACASTLKSVIHSTGTCPPPFECES
jgi:streptomycin 6-kinase